MSDRFSTTYPKGLGFLIWHLTDMPDAEYLAAWLKWYGVRWVSIKLLESTTPFNRLGGADDELREYIKTLWLAGIEVGGWSFNYPYSPGPEGAAIGERIEKLVNIREDGRRDRMLTHWLINAEASWKEANYGRRADMLCASIRSNVPQKVGLYLCTYRYPALHTAFPFKRFLEKGLSGAAPQVYWLGSHNPAEQLQKSYEQYLPLLQPNEEYPADDMRFMPIGSAFPWGTKWEPSADDFMEFEAAVKAHNFSTWGYYSLDKIMTGKRWDWMKAITGKDEYVPPEPPPPPPPPPGDGKLKFKVAVPKLNVREGPGVGYKDVGDVYAGDTFIVDDINGAEAWIKTQAGTWICVTQTISGVKHQYMVKSEEQ